MSPKLIELYRLMSEHTFPECQRGCRVPLSCCSPEYCEQARLWAMRKRVALVETDHPTLPYMGPHGCTVPPHLRPICTLHVCCINAFGFKPGDEAWTEKYWKLRWAIDEQEYRDVWNL